MPKIKPFKAIRPGAAFADKVVLQVENLGLKEAKIIRQQNPYSYINMLVPKIENYFLRGSKKELAYKKINENFDEFLEKNILVRDEKPSLYVYQITHRGLVQTGIWTTTSIDDYLNNTIKKHELTRTDREKELIDYLQQTGIDANPVLITYPPVDEINNTISKTVNQLPELHFHTQYAEHKLWKIDAEKDVVNLVNAFVDLKASYIADGHHRAAAASLTGIERRKLNLKHIGGEEYNFFTSVYMATDQLRIFEFHRLVKDLGENSKEGFLDRLKEHFEIEPAGSVVKPQQLHQFGMYLDKNWYKLIARKHTYRQNKPVTELDVTILQDFVLSPLLNISDPRTDARLSFVGGILPVEEIIKQVSTGEYAVAFILFPMSIEQLVRVADAGEVMPPKSTWFEPKFLVGLVVHQID